MSTLTDTEKAQAQHATGLFLRFSLDSGLQNMNLKHDLDIVYNFIEGLRGTSGIIVHKSKDGTCCSISFNGVDADETTGAGTWPPYGWEEETLNVITDAGIVTRTCLVKTSTKASVEAFTETDSRLILQVSPAGVIRKDRGYFKA